jgi:hypothetical protein
MTLRHISPRSVEWYEAILEDEPEEDNLSAREALALRTMKALEDAEIRIALARPARASATGTRAHLTLPFDRLPARHA